MLTEIEEGEVLHVTTPHITNIIIDCTTMGYVDYVGVATLNQVILYKSRTKLHIDFPNISIIFGILLLSPG